MSLEEKVYQKTWELKNLNEELEERIVSALEDLRSKDILLLNQSKQAQMGEMLENIAHQWRQPLTLINSTVMIIDLLVHDKEIDLKELERKLDKIESVTEYMSQTIDDFKNFLDRDKVKQNFNLKENIEKSVAIIHDSLTFYEINLDLDLDESIIINGYSNELRQVILILIKNAKDILLANKIKDAKIIMSAKKVDNRVLIKVSDNAGGIDTNIIDKIFDPYFTTKHKSQGTGLGLYMSKKLIEQSAKGEIFVTNMSEGACFTIILDC